MSWNEKADVSFKVTVLGDSGVGKTSVVLRRCEGTLTSITVRRQSAFPQQSTIVKIGRTNVELKLWDTAGQEQYSSLVPMFCRGH
jgi:GTPase SAR1 family protein